MFKLIAFLLLTPFIALGAESKIILEPHNTVVIRGPIDDSSMSKAQIQLTTLVIKRGLKDYPIYLVLDSPGGSISDGQDFIEFASTIKNLKTITMFAASMASAIVQALPGERIAIKTAWMMFHRAKGQFSGQFETGEVESRLQMAQKLVRRLEKTNATRLGLKLEDYKARVVNEYWLDSDDMIADKAVDRIAQIVCTPDLYRKKDKVTVGGFFGQSEIIFSACPLFKNPLPQEEL